MGRIILASKSPRRIELFEKYGIKAESIPADIDETVPDTVKEPCEQVRYLSLKKAQAIFEKCGKDCVVIAADTLVFADGMCLGKPKDKSEALDMMRKLSDNEHSVISGICIISGEKTVCESVTTKVVFRKITESEAQLYVSTDEPYDKAGGYGIQGLAGAFVSEIHGDYYNVVGLPVARLIAILQTEFGIEIIPELLKKRGITRE